MQYDSMCQLWERLPQVSYRSRGFVLKIVPGTDPESCSLPPDAKLPSFSKPWY